MNSGANFDGIHFDPEDIDRAPEGQVIPIGSRLPYNVQIPTGKLLDILMALAPAAQRLNVQEKGSVERGFSGRCIPELDQASV